MPLSVSIDILQLRDKTAPLGYEAFYSELIPLFIDRSCAGADEVSRWVLNGQAHTLLGEGRSIDIIISCYDEVFPSSELDAMLPLLRQILPS